MPSRYWVDDGSYGLWHDANNWATVSNGAGGAGIPTASDDVFFDGFGHAICQTGGVAFVCNDLTFEATATEITLLDSSGVINGDLEVNAGYFGPTGGPGYVIELKGNCLFTGGSLSVGTGPGVDPTFIFSGTGVTFANNGTSSASFQNVLVSGTLTVSGTKLSQFLIYQKLSITGTMTINKYDLITICRVDLNGANAGLDVFTGTLDGTGRFWWNYRESDTVPDTGTIEIAFFRFRLNNGLIDEPIDEDLLVDGWSNVHQDWTHNGSEPWLADNDGDVNYISLPALAGSVGLYDEYYSVADIDSDDWLSISLSKVKVHLRGRLYDGVGGRAMAIMVKAYLWDGSVWQDGGDAIFVSTSYADRTCSTDLSAAFTTIPQVDGMRIKLEVSAVIGDGADKGGINITQAWVEIEGTSYRNPVFELAPRTWLSPCEVEIEYTDDAQTVQLLGTARHYFMNKLTIHCDVSPASQHTALFDCDTNKAEMWVHGIFNVWKDAFPWHVFTVKFGEGTHVFRSSVDFYFSYSSGAATQLIVDPGEGTLILWPRGLTRVIILP